MCVCNIQHSPEEIMKVTVSLLFLSLPRKIIVKNENRKQVHQKILTMALVKKFSNIALIHKESQDLQRDQLKIPEEMRKQTDEENLTSLIILNKYLLLIAVNCQFIGPNGSAGIQM